MSITPSRCSQSGLEFLTELASFPEDTDPDWMKTLEEDGQGPGGKPHCYRLE
jgi:hypothetical protein